MFRKVVRTLCRHSGGIALVAGAIGVLSGVERLLSDHPAPRPIDSPKPASPLPTARQRKDYFTIRQTRSELGYVYWVLQGIGAYRSFALFDTWQEAMDEALRRSEQYSAALV